MMNDGMMGGMSWMPAGMGLFWVAVGILIVAGLVWLLRRSR